MTIRGLTGVPIHRGSWFGLPDIGFTEWIAKKIKAPFTPEGGSDILHFQRAEEPAFRLIPGPYTKPIGTTYLQNYSAF